MNRTDRLYALAEELRAAGPRGRTASWLAARFEVHLRTVKRDVSALQQAGVPVTGTGGPGGGYVLDAAASLPPLAFTDAEATAVAVALSVQPDLPFAADGRSALAKLRAAMPPAARAAADDLGSRVWLRTEGAPGRGPAARVLDEALRDRVVVVLDYVDAAGTSTQRRPVEPLLLARTGGHWYLVAWCRRRRAGRWFRLDRVAGAVATTERCPERDLAQVVGTPPADARPLG
ncbi:helix-turn-helix transcriptional regulator [Vallicoccus soli]|uniref:WYL domain-containing protein n=1 Tax=Vallicoccus soli TaxID=2339232 RepID=A0A3A3Z3M1_9ACTN|nr:WYL domain-containing protein [Vallicoccus soli]RJK98022.1 WYL domain-containing protein [Vallicoccus soli]